MKQEHSEQNKATRFKPGQSGNPGGRPKGFGAYVREKTKDGKLLVDDALSVLRCKNSSDTARASARLFLAQYGFGKPVENIDINANIAIAEYVQVLGAFIDPSKREELARYLTSI